MSKRWQSCERKVRYTGSRKAMKALNRAGLFPTLTVYHCRYCDGWHTGHPPRVVNGADA